MGIDDEIPGWHKPFIEVPEGVELIRVGSLQSILVDACQYEAAIAVVPIIGKVPVITFKFTSSQGVKLPPFTLMMSADYLRKFQDGLNEAFDAAIRKAGKHGVG